VSLLSTHGPVGDYRPPAGGHDEMIDEHGAVRAHWTVLADGYQHLGVDELVRRSEEIQLLLEQDGVTYNSIADDRPRRPWTLDPVPLVLTGDEWSVLERGIAQRAELFDLILSDLYGERRLLRTGVVPAEMILADPGFLRACDGIVLPGERQLVVLALDLARVGDGSWLTLGHRAQAPSGAAYALENRRVLSRVFPRLFRDAGVQRLAPFIRALRTALQEVAPPGVDEPNVVVLSPGALSETAFEHASIAAQLGYPLVQGADLEVRDGQVWLRTVADQLPVHVILRRVDAWFCDPLELRPDSTLGIAGLVDACRTGSVSVVNPLGSGVLENAGLAAVLPTVARHLLDVDLLLPPVPSWWCGDPASRSHVLANLGRLVVRPLSRATLEHSIDTGVASTAELDDLRRRIEAKPDRWVGQERVHPATAPVLSGTRLSPRPVVLRSFAVAQGDGYSVMAGGLARAGSGDPDLPIANRAGARSKDTWVLSTAPESQRGFWLADLDQPVRAATETLPARAAENFFWLGRYAERAEGTVRLLRIVNGRRDEFENAEVGPGPAALAVLLETVTRVTGTYPGFVGDEAEHLRGRPTDELFSLVVDGRRPGSIAHAVTAMLDAIDELRDQLSVDTWLVVGSLQGELDRLDHVLGERDEAVTNVLNDLLHGLLSLSGVATESMVRDSGWHFMDAGRRIERGINLASLLTGALGAERSAAVESLLIESVLTAEESIITYRRRYRSRARLAAVVELLLGDSGNPRSLRFSTDRLSEDLDLLAETRSGAVLAVRPMVDDLRSMVSAMDAELLAGTDDRGFRRELAAFGGTVVSSLAAVSEGMTADFFARPLPQRTVFTPVELPEPPSP
jgi:uncharacterized circularly permuted ATP-grasp superfamily protein/uncharacterized alpha-E superfamily protein